MLSWLRKKATPSEPPQPLKSIDERYRILEQVGRGERSVVHRAELVNPKKVPKKTLAGVTLEDEQLEFAVKMLLPEFCINQEYRARFDREARICSKFKHPSLIRTYEFGEQDGQMYLLMELVKGTKLRARMKGKRMKVDEVMHYLRQIMRATDEAHHGGVIHRNLSPDNILITDKNIVKIVGFGLAKGRDVESLTTETVVGSIEYMAPERWNGVYSPASDQYSVGVLIFHMLAGRPPFESTNPLELMKMHTETPPPSLCKETENTVNEPFESVVYRMLAKDPRHRFKSLGDALKDLETAVTILRNTNAAEFAAAAIPEVEVSAEPAEAPPETTPEAPEA
jgi:serine/threonine-protein kinase